MTQYELTSDRLGMRRWLDRDLEPFAKLNCDPRVMEFFPHTLDLNQTRQAVQQFNAHLDAHGFTYYAVETLESQEFLGFVGLKVQLFDHPMTPMVDCGWRLHHSAWGRGYASEAARRCLSLAFETLNIHEVSAIAPQLNVRSTAVMQRIGMTLRESFRHPLISAGSPLVDCDRYSTVRSEHWRNL